MMPDAAAFAVRELASVLHLSADEVQMPPLQLLRLIHRTVRLRVLPAIAAEDSGSYVASSRDEAAISATVGHDIASSGRRPIVKPQPPTATELLDLQTFPLGFTTHDSTADHAAAILRMLYVLDLRELQDVVNDILVTVQEFTANPKTDASLGQVGR